MPSGTLPFQRGVPPVPNLLRRATGQPFWQGYSSHRESKVAGGLRAADLRAGTPETTAEQAFLSAHLFKPVD
ncbi:hypothetical protein Aiant_34350 [Actinoplanes ianthinogenes]|uniref:Uncharacterized protein n=1 Tax=Actinoplanes ianthinogenes TaxID=122358 RepID=A0ABN6CC48_9ACTN|nr:hypothetical protein Aiant_34350 [Actinoplanes ianthinogenes]